VAKQDIQTVKHLFLYKGHVSHGRKKSIQDFLNTTCEFSPMEMACFIIAVEILGGHPITAGRIRFSWKIESLGVGVHRLEPPQALIKEGVIVLQQCTTVDGRNPKRPPGM